MRWLTLRRPAPARPGWLPRWPWYVFLILRLALLAVGILMLMTERWMVGIVLTLAVAAMAYYGLGARSPADLVDGDDPR